MEHIYTVFPDVEGMEYTNYGMPQDFETMEEAKAWQKELEENGITSVMESPN